MLEKDADATRLTLDVLMAWYGCALPEEAVERCGEDMARIIKGFGSLPPPPFDLHAHHYAPLLEALADE